MSAQKNNINTIDYSEYKKKIINCPDIFKVDQDGVLDVFAYKKCSNDSDELIKNCRSTIFHNNNIISKGFIFTPEYTPDNYTEINSMINFDKNDKISFFKSYEGFLIRIFYFQDKWYVTTNKRLNAFRSFWASRESFGSIFVNALKAGVGFDSELSDRLNESENIMDNFLDCIHKNYQYTFIVSNSRDNRIVCDSPDLCTMFHLETLDVATGTTVEDDYIGVPRPELLKFNSYNEIYSYVNNIDISKYQGILVQTQTGQFKILNSFYKKLFDLRGNEASLSFRYIQLRKSSSPADLDMFVKMYPAILEKIIFIENKILYTCSFMHDLYTSRYIKKINKETLISEQYNFLKKCHNIYINTKEYISKNVVLNTLNSIPPSNLNRLLKTITYDY